jgi:hypothetical protein
MEVWKLDCLASAKCSWCWRNEAHVVLSLHRRKQHSKAQTSAPPDTSWAYQVVIVLDHGKSLKDSTHPLCPSKTPK